MGAVGPSVVPVLEGRGDGFDVSWRWIGNTKMLDDILRQKGRNVRIVQIIIDDVFRFVERISCFWIVNILQAKGPFIVKVT